MPLLKCPKKELISIVISFQQSGIPYVEVLCRNRYVGRSFIQPDTRSRQLAVAKKFGAITANLEGRRVVLVDDSIVRGTTIGPLVRLLKQYGAKEVGLDGFVEL